MWNAEPILLSLINICLEHFIALHALYRSHEFLSERQPKYLPTIFGLDVINYNLPVSGYTLE
jgi:hypothetical protein